MGDGFTLRWRDAGGELLGQRVLPEREVYLLCATVEEVARAIETLAVRGAPAIGCAAAFGVARAARVSAAASLDALAADVAAAVERLARTRPTAVNLFWALERMGRCCAAACAEAGASPSTLRAALLREAQAVLEEDVAACRALGRAGAALVPDGARILTHCNAGALATGGYGTALGVVRAAVEAGRRVSVLADETRPFLQGARLTAWELARDGIPVAVVTDGMPAHLMRRGEVDLVIVGADRVAANGDVANKIGTYGLALLAKAHGIPFYLAAPCSGLLKRILPPKSKRTINEPDPFTQQDLERFLQVAWAKLPEPFPLILETMAMTGMRLGGALAMREENLDSGNHQYQVTESTKLGRFGPPKSGKRLIDLDATLVAKLETHIKRMRKKSMAEGNLPSFYLFPGITQRMVQRAMARVCKAARIRVRHPHDLRHSYATILLMAHMSRPASRS